MERYHPYQPFQIGANNIYNQVAASVELVTLAVLVFLIDGSTPSLAKISMAHSSIGLGHSLFMAVSGVRLPSGLPMPLSYSWSSTSGSQPEDVEFESPKRCQVTVLVYVDCAVDSKSAGACSTRADRAI